MHAGMPARSGRAENALGGRAWNGPVRNRVAVLRSPYSPYHGAALKTTLKAALKAAPQPAR
ncbi:hypothetical protein GCM10022226_70460 [Sphaerisporangium flaviroseum]|uniref:Uncharacterized protein n=1 Tax=Sphaerisporangium flaviroseum TaxID=509199 RepID=A0ABP7JAI1_9ACTN